MKKEDIPKLKLRSVRGFAAMDRETRRRISSLGGRAAQASRTAHRFDSDTARAAGRKGGKTCASRAGYMQMLGRLGGLRAAINKKRKEYEHLGERKAP